MSAKPLHFAVHRICVTLILTALTVPILASGTLNPWEQTDWKQWTRSDVRKILTNSPWVAICCQSWEAGGESVPPDSGATAVMVSSQTVREALVRQLHMEKRYALLDPSRRRETDQRIEACLNDKFDNDIVFSFSFLGTWKRPDGGVVKVSADAIRLITSDGRKVAGQLVSDSIAMACGALPEDNFDRSIGVPFGRGKEVAFARFVDGKPTIAAGDKTIRINSGFSTNGYPGHSKDYPDFDFKMAKLIYQGKPDF